MLKGLLDNDIKSVIEAQDHVLKKIDTVTAGTAGGSAGTSRHGGRSER